MSVIPRPLPNEVIKGEHFVFADLLKSLPRGSTQAKAVPKPLVWPDYLPLAVQDLKQAQAMTKKKKSGQAKDAGEGLEGFVDWTNLEASQSIEEREAKMFGLIIGFAIRIHKLAAKAQEGTTPDLEVLGDKHSRSSRYDEEVQPNPTVIVVDSSERVLEAPST